MCEHCRRKHYLCLQGNFVRAGQCQFGALATPYQTSCSYALITMWRESRGFVSKTNWSNVMYYREWTMLLGTADKPCSSQGIRSWKMWEFDMSWEKIGARETKSKWNIIVNKLTINQHENFFYWCFLWLSALPNPVKVTPHWADCRTVGGDGRSNLGLPFLLRRALLPLLVWSNDCLHLHLPIQITLLFPRRRSHNNLHKKFRTWWCTSLNISYFSLALSLSVCPRLPPRHALILICPKLLFAFSHPNSSSPIRHHLSTLIEIFLCSPSHWFALHQYLSTTHSYNMPKPLQSTYSKHSYTITNFVMDFFIFCWPCVIMYHNNVTNLIPQLATSQQLQVHATHTKNC
jgi:hypothetical protein